MMTTMNEELAVDLARECLYRFLAAGLSDPRSKRWSLIADAEVRSVAVNSADLLRSENEPVTVGFGERPLNELDLSLPDSGLDASRDDWIADYDQAFGLLPSREFPPYETEYLANSEPSFRAQQLADIAGYYLAFGLQPGRSGGERLDHITMELEFMAVLIGLLRRATSEDHIAVCRDAEQSFFRDHLAWWVSAFARLLGQKAAVGPYATIARVLAAFLPIERTRFGVEPPLLPRKSLPMTETEDINTEAACSA